MGPVNKAKENLGLEPRAEVIALVYSLDALDSSKERWLDLEKTFMRMQRADQRDKRKPAGQGGLKEGKLCVLLTK